MAWKNKTMDGPREPSVFVWPASCYNTASHHWDYGELQVTPSTLCFYDHMSAISTPEQQARSLQKMIKLENVIEVKKTLSSYFFKCLVVLTKDGVDHWFGSLPGRDGAYNTILHFWRERLFDHPHHTCEQQDPQTSLGTELLSIVQDSRSTMNEAAETLKQQGEQINNAKSVMFDLHNDLDVADRITSKLESWFSHWGITEQTLPKEPSVLVTAEGVPVIHEFPVLYHAAGGGPPPHPHQNHYDAGATSVLTKLHLSPRRGPPINEQSGHLRLSKDGITILNADKIPLHHFKIGDISTINVTSPWKISIIRYCIGEPDIVYRLTSVQMVSVLPVLHTISGPQIKYESLVGTPVADPVWPGAGNDKTMTVTENQLHPIVENLDNKDFQIHLSPKVTAKHPQVLRVKNGQIQKKAQKMVQKKPVVSHGEVNQLSDLLGEMKSMALDINTEHQKQDENITELTELVDNANIRLNVENKRIKELM